MSRYESTRRKFLASLGLGVGASMLSPVADLLINEALGQVPQQHRALIFTTGVLNHTLWAPGSNNYTQDAQTLSAGEFAWPTALEPLRSRRNQTLLLDNLHSDISTGTSQDSSINHGYGYGHLSCLRPNGSPEDLDPPAGITIDQFLANRFSASAPKKSILIGASGKGYERNLDEELNLFASGPNLPLPHFTQAATLFARLFPDGGQGSNGPDPRELKLTEVLHQDINRLRSKLAAPERARLQSYEEAFEDFDQRRNNGNALSCDAPSAPGQRANPETELARLMDLATLALKCGMTNVVGVAVGTHSSHSDHMPHYGFHRRFEVHGTDASVDAQRDHIEPLRAIWDYHAGLVANAMDELEGTTLGDSNALDGTLVVMTSARGIRDGQATHHAPTKTGGRFPALIAGKPPGMNLNGRYIAYDRASYGMVDFWRACAERYGISGSNFAQGAKNSRGTLPQLG